MGYFQVKIIEILLTVDLTLIWFILLEKTQNSWKTSKEKLMTNVQMN